MAIVKGATFADIIIKQQPGQISQKPANSIFIDLKRKVLKGIGMQVGCRVSTLSAEAQ